MGTMSYLVKSKAAHSPEQLFASALQQLVNTTKSLQIKDVLPSLFPHWDMQSVTNTTESTMVGFSGLQSLLVDQGLSHKQ